MMRARKAARIEQAPRSRTHKPYAGGMDSMLAASLRSPGELVVDKRPVPTLGPRDVLLAVEATTLCGTDLRIATGQKTNGVTPGVVLGHEIAARVWRIGDELTAGVDVPAPGTQVGLAPEIACGRCEPCMSGRSNVCAHMRLFGTGVNGGLADLVLVPEEALACITPVAGERSPSHSPAVCAQRNDCPSNPTPAYLFWERDRSDSSTADSLLPPARASWRAAVRRASTPRERWEPS